MDHGIVAIKKYNPMTLLLNFCVAQWICPGSLQSDVKFLIARLDSVFLDEAKKGGWAVADMKKDWKVIYPHELK